ncbi:MAG TPA: hypothetical protein P5550_02995, partial [Bacteroidales bacterium]|nr:hypothetical protein [Bacteroidales bacterium]
GHEEAEARGDYLYSGGAWHRWTGGLRQPGLVFLDLPIAFSTGKYGTLFLHNHYKQFTRSWDVRFAGDALDYGHYEDRDGQAVFFFDRPPRYEVVGLERSGMQAVTGYGGWFRSNPHAMGNTIGFRREAPRFYLDLAWTSHMIIGYSAMGYGFMHNSPGLLSESLAQPNTRTRMFGRSDADRGYYAKLLLGWKISKSLSTSFQFAWVDGQPFTKFLYYTDEDQAQRQLALWPYVERGNSGWSGDFGPREDGFFDSVLRMQYQRAFGGHSLGMVLSVYNLFDFGTNLAEYAFPEGDSRYVLEFTAPRGMMLRVWMEM